jgi:hypothetical protein
LNIEGYIQKQLEGVDIQDLVESEIKRLVSDDIRKAISLTVKTHIDRIVKTEIEIAMAGEVLTNDGWGKKNKYESFQALFKELFKKRLDESWDMKKLIENAIKERVDYLFKHEEKAIKQSIIDGIAKLG